MSNVRLSRRGERERECHIKLLGECNLMMRALKDEKFSVDKLQLRD